MFNPIFFYEQGKSRSGTALIPFFDTKTVYMGFSTYVGDFVVTNLNGSVQNVNPPKKIDTYAAANSQSLTNAGGDNGSIYTGNVAIKFLSGLKDVYSFSMTNYQSQENYHKVNIQNWGNFINQFPTLNNFRLFFYAYNQTSRYAVIKGDMAVMPDSVEKVLIENLNIANNNISNPDVWFNLNTLKSTSNLKYFLLGSPVYNSYLQLRGDLAKLPQSVCFFQFSSPALGSSITYTSGKIWASSFDTLSIPLNLSVSKTNALLNDMNNCIINAIGGKTIYLDSCRDLNSDSAVASLQSKGFTVNVKKVQKILDVPLQNNFIDQTGINTMVAAGTLPTFVAGRNGTDFAASFNGSQSIKTNANLPINASGMHISMYIKTTQTTTAVITELSTDLNSNNAFGTFINNSSANRIDIVDRGTNYNVGYSSININDGNWHKVEMIIDRSKNGVNQNKIYIDGVLSYIQSPSYTTDNNGNFGNFPLFIGQRGGSSLGFVGQIQELEIYKIL